MKENNQNANLVDGGKTEIEKRLLEVEQEARTLKGRIEVCNRDILQLKEIMQLHTSRVFF